MAVTDQDILNECQQHLIETEDSGSTWSSGMWTVAEVIGYLNQRTRRFQLETFAILSRATLSTIPNTHRHDLPTDWIASYRVAWRDTAGTITGLHRADSWEADRGDATWPFNTVTIPKWYMDAETPTRRIQIAPASFDNGVLDIVYAAVMATLSNTGISIGLPDEYTPAIKWGVVADMLSKVGQAHDPGRAAYAETRYQEGVEAARLILRGTG